MALATKTRRKTAHPKRSANHHKRTKRYLNPYWPYIPMLLIVGIGFYLNHAWSAKAAVLGSKADFSYQTLLEQTNKERNKHNLVSLTINNQLSKAAQAKAENMVSEDYWSHNTPSGKTPWAFITDSGYQYQTAGENLAYGFRGAKETVRGWMNSPEHRDNILNSTYQEVGFGVASSPDYQKHGPATVVVAEYAQPAGAAANITFTVNNSNAVKGSNSKLELAAEKVSRIELITGGNSWVLIAMSAITGAAIAVFVVRHGIRIKKMIHQGESFVSHHPILDILIVLVITAGILLTRTGGFIR